MPHIHTNNGEKDQTASGIIVRTDLDEPKVVLHMHRKLGKWLYFGGHVELNEHPWQAISHELAEESGYELQQLRLLQPKSRIKKLGYGILHPMPVCFNTHPITEEHSHIDAVFAFTAQQEPTGTPDEGESTDIRLFTVDEVRQLSDDTWQSVIDISTFVLEEALVEWEEVDAKEF